MSQKATGALTQTALEVVKAQVDRMTDYVIDYNQIELSIDAEASEFVLTARAVPPDGAASAYVGEIRRPYEKSSLDLLLPGPVFIDMIYPVTYNQLRTYLKDVYDIVMEEEELAKATTPTVPLLNADYVDDALERTLGIVELVVTPRSGRFIAGARLPLIFAFAGSQRRLQDAYRQTKIPKISDLKFSANSTSNVSLYNATALDCATEFFRRHHGVEMDSSQIDPQIFSVDHHRGLVLLQPKYDSPSPWTGAAQLLYDKVDIGSMCPDYLQIRLPYPATYQAVRSFLLQSYGLQLEEGEVSAGSYGNPALRGADLINVPLQGHGFLDLVIQKSSYKWKGRSKLRVQFVQAPSETVGPKITSTAPDGVQGVAWAYQTVVVGGTAPYTFERFGVAPVALAGGTGLYSGIPAEGFYLWMTLVRDATGLIGVKTETALIGPPIDDGPDFGFVSDDATKYYVSSATQVPYFPYVPEELG